MTQHEVAKTLVKSAPELWEVCSDPDSLSRHLEAFGDIRITRVEPESTVAWEGERASGTVRIEPSGWGTRVILTATPVEEPEPPEMAAQPEPEALAPPSPEPVGEPAAPETTTDEPEPVPARRGFFRRLGGLLFRSLVTPVEIPDEAFAASPPEAPEAASSGPGASLAESEPVAVEPEPRPEPEPEPVEPAPMAPVDAGQVLQTMLSRLGSDHHRPFSRS